MIFKKQQRAKIRERTAIPLHTELTQSVAPHWDEALKREVR